MRRREGSGMAMTITAGGNDIWFSKLIMALLLRENGDIKVTVDKIKDAVYNGKW
jgi:hypothetical protein